MRGNIALPLFWRQALDALKELDLTRIQLSTDGAPTQPIWDNRLLPPPPIPKLFRDRWESLEVTVIHTMCSDLEGKVRFDKETNASQINMELDNHHFQQQKINNERFLDSWEVIGDHLHEQMECFRPTTTKSEKKPAFGEPDSVHITTDGEYVICICENSYEGIPNALGELAIGDALDETPDNIDTSPPTRWGKGYKGPRRESFPLPDEYALDENETPLDVTSVKILTTTFSSKRKHKPHPSIAAWNQRLPLSKEMWTIITSRYTNTLLTPRDYHLHFKHITHRRIATNNRFVDQSNLCRFCHTHEETSLHLGRCPGLTTIFNTLNKAVNFHPSKDRSILQKALDTLFCLPCRDTPACVAQLHMIAWRFIITDFIAYITTRRPPPSMRCKHTLFLLARLSATPSY
jgi:hypothetical protein